MNMKKFLALLNDYRGRLDANVDAAPERFSDLFAEGVEYLRLEDNEIAERFSASRPTANRWRNGKSAPALGMRKLIISELEKITSARIRKLKKTERKLEERERERERVATDSNSATDSAGHMGAKSA